MKQFMRLLACCLLLTALMGLCAAAQAEVDTVTITVNVVDRDTGEPVPKTLYLWHSQCIQWKEHTPGSAECDCFRTLSSLIWQLDGHTPCDCGETWTEGYYKDTDGWHKYSSTTFTIKTGHKYLLGICYDDFGKSEYHTRQRPSAAIYADPATGKVTFEKHGVNLTQTGKNTFQIGLINRLSPVTVNINGTKLMDGKDPGSLKFAFKVWMLTDDEMMDAYDFNELLLDEDFEGYNPDDFDPDIPIEEQLPEEIIEKICTRLYARLDKYPSTIVYNTGKNIPILNKTFLPGDLTDGYMRFNYVIAEVEQQGNAICEDPAIFCVSGYINGFYFVAPQSVNADGLQTQEKNFIFAFDNVSPMTYALDRLMGISPTGGLLLLEQEDLKGKNIAEEIVFRNTTCPYADPEPEKPEVPQTGDGSSMMLWAGLMLITGAAVLLLRRRA